MNKGYTIEHNGVTDLIYLSTHHLSEKISSLAYMDDTNWIASSQQNLEDILSVAEEFYSFTRSALNKEKSKLLTTSHQSTIGIDLKFGSSSINITPKRVQLDFWEFGLILINRRLLSNVKLN